MRWLLVALLSACATAPATTKPVRTRDLLDHPEWAGREVTVDVVEPVQSIGDKNAYDVRANGGTHHVELVPGKLAALPNGLHAPQRVRGTLRQGSDGLQIEVAELIAIPLPKPVHLASAAELFVDPARWNGQYVEVEETYHVGFERSLIGNGGPGQRVWLQSYPDLRVVCEPAQRIPEARIHVTGWAYTGGRYGHLGQGNAKIEATAIEYLSPSSCAKPAP